MCKHLYHITLLDGLINGYSGLVSIAKCDSRPLIAFGHQGSCTLDIFSVLFRFGVWTKSLKEARGLDRGPDKGHRLTFRPPI